MLSLGKIVAGPGAAAYYTEQVARGREDYYAGAGERPGQWAGTGAAALGLSGEVDAERFAELLAGAGLRRPVKDGAVAGFDMTFRAPKSVSVLWGICEPEIAAQLRAGHEAAVAEALGYLEREACWARRGRGGLVQVRGGGFVAAAFLHRASRAGDPLLHTHVVAGNLTQGPDGRWTALDARHLYRHAKTAGFLYQAALRRELTERLGVAWLEVERGVADVDGVPRAVIEHFSTRRRQILEHLAEHGAHSARAAQVAALETRAAKDEAPADRMRELWRARAAEHGLHPADVALLLGREHRVPHPEWIDVQQLTEQASSFGRPELLQALAAAQPRGAHVGDLEQMADLALHDAEVVRLADGPAAGGAIERRFSTRELLEIEAGLLEQADQRRSSGAAVARREAVDAAIGGRALSREQEAMVRRLCQDGHGIDVVRAPAGAGKTFALDAAREAWQADGTTVLGCALSARAALELTDQAAIEATTIAKLTGDLDRGLLPRRAVLVVDEAGMVGSRALAELAEATRLADGKLVLVGDDRQLPEIQAGGAFRALADRLDAVQLRDNHRQRHAWDRDALQALRDGEVERWARAYRDHGRLTIARDAGEARAALVNDWSRAEGDRLMIAARRDDVRDLNQRARQLLQATGRLGVDELEIDGRGFAVGDRVIGCRNDRHAGILNGQRGTIRHIDAEQRTVQVTLDHGRDVQLGRDYLDAGHLDHGYAITAHRAQGATVDHSFVLGSEELYREWGYTALSRHRGQARFYLARTDLDVDRDLPPTGDPQIAAISRLLTRTNAKDLALDQLRDTDRAALERERDELRQRLAGHPALDRDPHAEHRHDITTAQAVQRADARIARLEHQQHQLPWRHRRQHAELDRQIADARDHRAAILDRRADHHALHDQADALDHTWLRKHAPDAHRLLSIDEELRRRAALDEQARERLRRHQPRATLDRGLRPRPPHHDRGIDLGP